MSNIAAADRFWAMVNKSGPPHPVLGTPCWSWTGSVSKSGLVRGKMIERGYGLFYDGQKIVQTHRHSYQMANGHVPVGLFVLHRCDVRTCVNPAHLFVGTHKDNMADMAAKGRSARGARNVALARPDLICRGEEVGTAKLSNSDVLEIRSLAGADMTHAEIANRFGVNQTTVSRIVRRIAWAHA